MNRRVFVVLGVLALAIAGHRSHIGNLIEFQTQVSKHIGGGVNLSYG